MRRIYYGLSATALVSFGLFRCWHGSKNDLKRTNTVTTVASNSDVLPLGATEVLPIPTISKPVAEIATKGTQSNDEVRLVRRLHVLETTNPRLAVSLALEDRQRFPDNPDAEERDMILVTALNNDRDILGAKREAWYYFMHYPNGKFAGYLSRLTGIMPPATLPRR